MKQIKRVIVTGAAGFVGVNLCKRLLSNRVEVLGIDCLFDRKRDSIDCLRNYNGFTFLKADIVNKLERKISKIWGLGDDEKVDEIYNLACPSSPLKYRHIPTWLDKTNVLGTLNVLEFARKHNSKVFQASTCEVYGDSLVVPQDENYFGNVNPIGPRSCYAEGKRFAETICSDYHSQYGLDVRVMRIFNVYGSGIPITDGRLIPNLIVRSLSNQDIELTGDGSQIRCFMYIDDLLDAIQGYMAYAPNLLNDWMLRERIDVPIVNCGNPCRTTIRELAHLILRAIPESQSKIVYVPSRKDDPRLRVPDISRISSLLGWSPKTELNEGVERTIAYFRSALRQ